MPRSRPSATSSRSSGRAVNPVMRKLLGCTRSSRRVRSLMAAAVIVDAGAVGGAHFAQHRARARHDLGNAEAVADLDQLAARDHDFAARRQFVQRQKDGRGIVVDGDAGRAQQALQQARGVRRRACRAGRRPDRIRGWSSRRAASKRPSGARPRLVCSTTPVALIDAPQRRAVRAPPGRCSTRTSTAAAGGAAARRISAARLHPARGGSPPPPARAGYRAQAGEAFEHFVDGRQFAQFLACSRF